MTAQAIEAFKAHCYEFCQEQHFTKQQTIAMTILAFFEQGIDIGSACQMVVGETAMAEISDVSWTQEELLDAVRRSFLEA